MTTDFEDKILLDGQIWTGLRLYLADTLIQKSILKYDEFKVKEPYEKYIYHYASIETFKAIIESQCFHSTNIAHVNDPTELEYAQKLIISIVEKLVIQREKQIEKDILTKLLSMLQKIEKSNRYISCFSINGDLKNQWNDYGDDGYGISIGFDPYLLKSTLDPITHGQHIIYEKVEQKKIIYYAINNIIDFYILHLDLFDWNGYDKVFLIAKELYEYCDLWLCLFKDIKYKDEKEYRLIVKTDGLPNYHPFTIEYKTKGNNQIPFIANKTDFQRRIEKYKDRDKEEYGYEYNVEFEYQLSKLPIREIIIGYNLSFSDAKENLAEICSKYNYHDVVFKKSVCQAN